MMPFDGSWYDPEPEPEPHIPHPALIAAVLAADATLWILGIWIVALVAPQFWRAIAFGVACGLAFAIPVIAQRLYLTPYRRAGLVGDPRQSVGSPSRAGSDRW